MHEMRQRAFMRRYRPEIAAFTPRVVRHRYSGLELEVELADPESA